MLHALAALAVIKSDWHVSRAIGQTRTWMGSSARLPFRLNSRLTKMQSKCCLHPAAASACWHRCRSYVCSLARLWAMRKQGTCTGDA